MMGSKKAAFNGRQIRRAKRSNRNHNNRMTGGGPRCDRWRTKLAILQSKLALRHRHKGFERLAKQIYKAYLEVVTLFCNDRFVPSTSSDRKIAAAKNSLDQALAYNLISHIDHSTATLKMATAMSGVRGATARRLVREIRSDIKSGKEENAEKLLQLTNSAMKILYQHPVSVEEAERPTNGRHQVRTSKRPVQPFFHGPDPEISAIREELGLD